MSQELMQACVDSRGVRKYVHYFGVKIQRLYPGLMDVEDAENELWAAVFRAISKRYTPEEPLIPFARHAVYSQYGTMINKRGNYGRLLNEGIDLNPDFMVDYDDPCYTEAENSFTLDQIREDLMECARASRQYRYAIQTFELMRNGATMRECCESLKISKNYGYKLLHEIIGGCGVKYHE